uniref:Putative secreted protein n=1 Tax=Amblyomma triste TaxID=251400 RepID=A0A023G1M9_AMBTT
MIIFLCLVLPLTFGIFAEAVVYNPGGPIVAHSQCMKKCNTRYPGFDCKEGCSCHYNRSNRNIGLCLATHLEPRKGWIPVPPRRQTVVSGITWT